MAARAAVTATAVAESQRGRAPLARRAERGQARSRRNRLRALPRKRRRDACGGAGFTEKGRLITDEGARPEAPAPIEEGPLELRGAGAAAARSGPGRDRVAACGVCHSNLHMIEGDWLAAGIPSTLPIIPGHEVVGTVERVGEGVTGARRRRRGRRAADLVDVRQLRVLPTGREQLCQTKEITGETLDGGYAEYMLADAAHAYPLPDGLDFAEAAPLFCPGSRARLGLKAGLSPARPSQSSASAASATW